MLCVRLMLIFVVSSFISCDEIKDPARGVKFCLS